MKGVVTNLTIMTTSTTICCNRLWVGHRPPDEAINSASGVYARQHQKERGHRAEGHGMSIGRHGGGGRDDSNVNNDMLCCDRSQGHIVMSPNLLQIAAIVGITCSCSRLSFLPQPCFTISPVSSPGGGPQFAVEWWCPWPSLWDTTCARQWDSFLEAIQKISLARGRCTTYYDMIGMAR